MGQRPVPTASLLQPNTRIEPRMYPDLSDQTDPLTVKT